MLSLSEVTSSSKALLNCVLSIVGVTAGKRVSLFRWLAFHTDHRGSKADMESGVAEAGRWFKPVWPRPKEGITDSCIRGRNTLRSGVFPGALSQALTGRGAPTGLPLSALSVVGGREE